MIQAHGAEEVELELGDPLLLGAAAKPPAGVEVPPTTCTRMSTPPTFSISAATRSVPAFVEVSAAMKRSGYYRPEGDFPGGVAELEYQFHLTEDGKIVRLDFAPSAY